MGPLLMTTPPAVGSRRPADLIEELRLAWRFRGLDVKTVGDVPVKVLATYVVEKGKPLATPAP